MKPLYQISEDSASVINKAMQYLHGSKVLVLGHGPKSREFIGKLKMPHLPLLADNKAERILYEASIAPWYTRLKNWVIKLLDKVVMGVLNFADRVCDLYDSEATKQFIPRNDLAYIEPPRSTDPKEDEEVPEEKEVMA